MIHDHLGWYYFFRGMIHFSLGVYGAYFSAYDFGVNVGFNILPSNQTEFTLSRAKVTPIGPNNPTPGDAASAYVISDNQIVA